MCRLAAANLHTTPTGVVVGVSVVVWEGGGGLTHRGVGVCNGWRVGAAAALPLPPSLSPLSFVACNLRALVTQYRGRDSEALRATGTRTNVKSPYHNERGLVVETSIYVYYLMND